MHSYEWAIGLFLDVHLLQHCFKPGSGCHILFKHTSEKENKLLFHTKYKGFLASLFNGSWDVWSSISQLSICFDEKDGYYFYCLSTVISCVRFDLIDTAAISCIH